VLGALADELRESCAGTFAGLAYASDGTLEVFSVGDETLDTIVSRVAAQAGLRLRVVNGMRNSVRDLEAVRNELRERMLTGETSGMRILELGLDERSNCVRVGLATLTPEAISELESQYGRHRLCVVQGGLFTTS
jgi:hypothetical protein